MKLVLLFFCIILIFIVSVLLLIALSSIKLNIRKCHISNIEKGVKKAKLDTEFELYIEFYLLRLIKLIKIPITKDKIEELIVKKNLDSLKKDAKIVKKIHLLEIIKSLKLKTEKVNLQIYFGLDSINLTVYAVAIISALLGIILAKVEPKETNFEVMPMYNIGNVIKFNLNCIITVKIVHIIYVIYILLRKRRNNHERTSNRRSYGYSYE
ncbi:MAG: hypothetical protein HFJ52_05255 [Clostridia bacterium]|nr:hypothetical protein [Clostridia bacterium]